MMQLDLLGHRKMPSDPVRREQRGDRDRQDCDVGLVTSKWAEFRQDSAKGRFSQLAGNEERAHEEYGMQT